MTPEPTRRGRRLSRRAFLRGVAGGAGWALAGCDAATEIEPEEVEALAQRTRDELARSGRGPLGPLRYRGYRGLAELPWFELDDAGHVVLAADDVPPGIDLHTHLGMAVLFAPTPDLQAATPRVAYVLDCDVPPGGCALDLDVYMNLNFTPAMLRRLRIGALRSFTIGDPAARTHTVPNLVAELDRAGFAQAAVLPIAFGLPFRDDLSERWLDAIAASPHASRLIPGCSVHPRDPERLARLRDFARRGARIVKLHPEAQRFYPDDPAVLELCAECERLGLAVLFHAGRSGIEPERIRAYALVRRFEEAAASFPRLPIVLGHAGARDLPDAVPLARRHRNLSLGIASLGASAIARLLHDVGPERVVFGSDWPFYPLVSSLAKLLLAARDRPDAVSLVLRDNAERLLRGGPA